MTISNKAFIDLIQEPKINIENGLTDDQPTLHPKQITNNNKSAYSISFIFIVLVIVFLVVKNNINYNKRLNLNYNKIQRQDLKPKVEPNVTTKAYYDSQIITDLDGNKYKTVNIGSQIWMVENLKTTKLNDGTVINLILDDYSWNTTNASGFCYYN